MSKLKMIKRLNFGPKALSNLLNSSNSLDSDLLSKNHKKEKGKTDCPKRTPNLLFTCLYFFCSCFPKFRALIFRGFAFSSLKCIKLFFFAHAFQQPINQGFNFRGFASSYFSKMHWAGNVQRMLLFSKPIPLQKFRRVDVENRDTKTKLSFY